MLIDYHVHTEYSDDSEYLMKQVIEDAINMEMKEICFTDHVDYGIKEDWDSKKEPKYYKGIPIRNVNYPEYIKEINELKERYKDRISIKTGLEFGMQSHTISQYEELFKRYPFDFIILSIHEVGNKELWTNEFQEGKSQEKYTKEYYEELLKVVKNYKNYSVLGHLDLVARYDVGNGKTPLEFNQIKPIITEILKTVIEDGKGIELNTSYHRYGLSDSTPSYEILNLYHQLGGRIITIGSDSHKPNHLGAYIEESKDYLKKIGFTEYCTFDQMKPLYHKL